MNIVNTLDKQIKGIIQNSISKTMNIKIPLQSNYEERNLLIEILKGQEEIKQQIQKMQIAMRIMSNEVNVINHHDYLQH